MEEYILSFSDIIGHEDVKSHINNSINNGRFAHAYIISGEDGLGKSILVKEIALKLLNKKVNRMYADIIEFKIKKESRSIKVDDIREINKEVNKKPYEEDKKVIIIYNSDFMTKEAQNAFLKTIEEPPKNVFILMLCESLDSILETIKSRCQIYKLNHLSQEDMKKYINKKYPNIDAELKETLLKISDGIPGKVEKFVEDENFKDIRDMSINILKKMLLSEKNDIESTLKYVEFFTKHIYLSEEVLTCFLSYIRDILMCKETLNKKLVLNIDKLEDLEIISESLSFKQLYNIINIIEDTKDKLSSNVNTALVFNSMLLKMQEV
ncbi:MAG: DNA polymerase III subunit delta' [Clostridium cochlearium]|uniref:DNA polymerase III subunit delta' n=1 Tax=Clostridium cochlearium TaxID=1494 RepID=UPI0022E7B709|nr:DNA polymerase III subunit delta' [Clostridium cochlearium]MDU1443814.1 DNA polymerase III subunit delta' [Clostridium cochlearium]